MKGKVIPCRGTEDRKGAGTTSGESGARNLEAVESIKSRVESMGGCVIVTEIRWRSAHGTFIIAVSVHLVLYIYSGVCYLVLYIYSRDCFSCTIHL